MPNYIEKEWVLEAVKHTDDMYPYKVPGEYDTYGQYNEGWSDACDYIRGELETMTAADVEPVVHAKNISDAHPSDEFHCGKCGLLLQGYYEYDPEDDACIEFVEWNSCPRCGANIDLED